MSFLLGLCLERTLRMGKWPPHARKDQRGAARTLLEAPALEESELSTSFDSSSTSPSFLPSFLLSSLPPHPPSPAPTARPSSLYRSHQLKADSLIQQKDLLPSCCPSRVPSSLSSSSLGERQIEQFSGDLLLGCDDDSVGGEDGDHGSGVVNGLHGVLDWSKKEGEEGSG